MLHADDLMSQCVCDCAKCLFGEARIFVFDKFDNVGPREGMLSRWLLILYT